MIELDKSRVYTALNADELKVGSMCVFAHSICGLRENVKNERYDELKEILADDVQCRFRSNTGCWTLAYLIKEPEEKKLLWTDLKVGDVIRNNRQFITALITQIDEHDTVHIKAGDDWLKDEDLAEWEKVEV